MKLLKIILAITLVAYAFTITSCAGVKCSINNNSITYSDDHTKLTACILCDINNKEIKNNFINIQKLLKMNKVFFLKQSGNANGQLFVIDSTGSHIMSSIFHAAFIDARRDKFKLIDKATLQNIPVELSSEIQADTEVYVLASEGDNTPSTSTGEGEE